MAAIQNIKFWGVAAAALFSISASAGELENYYALKSAMVRSDAKRDRPIPAWVPAEKFEPRPWLYLNDKNKPAVPVVSLEPPIKVPDSIKPADSVNTDDSKKPLDVLKVENNKGVKNVN